MVAPWRGNDEGREEPPLEFSNMPGVKPVSWELGFPPAPSPPHDCFKSFVVGGGLAAPSGKVEDALRAAGFRPLPVGVGDLVLIRMGFGCGISEWNM